MSLYYCMYCGVVRAFCIPAIRKHGGRLPNDTDCPVCDNRQAYLPVEDTQTNG